MDFFIKQKIIKKIVIAILLIVLLCFSFPKNVNAGLLDDIAAAPAKVLFWIEKGVFKFLNDIFTSEQYKANSGQQITNGQVTETLSIYLTPENIIKGKFLIFEANIFKKVDSNDVYYDYVDPSNRSNNDVIAEAVTKGREDLRNNIAGWYYALRNLAIVALLSILVYVGIRMVISTISQDKAKYKIMFKDWLIALCLLFLLHYIMITMLNLTTEITKALGSGTNTDMISSTISKITNVLNNDEYTYTDPNSNKVYDLGDAYANILVLIGVIGYTLIFAVKYLKREFTIVFLILLAPISCITYPIDKISDGKAQAYNKWFTEFLYEVIIQPFHLLIYIVLVGSAVELANTNILYGIICFAVMIPAEKFIKSMFGFRDELGSPLGSFGAGAIASQILSKAKGAVSNISNKDKNSDGGSKNIDDDSVHTKDPVLPGADNDSSNSKNDTPKEEKPAIDERKKESNYDDKNEENSLEENEGSLANNENNERQSIEEGEGSPADDENNEGQFIEEGEDSSADDENNESHPVGNGEEYPNDNNDESEDDEFTVTDRDEDNSEYTDDLIEKQTENPAEDSDSEIKSKNNKVIKMGKDAFNALQKKHNYKVMSKYGTLNTKELAKKRLWRATKKASKFAGRTIKKGVTLTGALAGGVLLGAAGAMFGKGKSAAALGAGGGVYLAKKINNLADKATEKIGEQAGIAYGGITANDKDKTKYKQNNVKKAQTMFKDRNKRNPKADELDNELNKMYEMSQRGIENSNIKNAMDLYNSLKDDEELDDKTAFETAIYSAAEAQYFDKKDFSNPEVMKNEFDNIVKAYENMGIDKNVAQEHAERILVSAGKMKGVNNVAIPVNNRSVDIPITTRVRNKLLQNCDISAEESATHIERINNVTARLVEKKFTDNEIEKIASLSIIEGNNANEIIEKFATSVDYVTADSQVSLSSKNTIEKVTGVQATEPQIRKESIERLSIKNEFGMEENTDTEARISSIREKALEMENKGVRVDGQSISEYTKKFAKDKEKELKDNDKLADEDNTIKQELVEKLKRSGNSEKKANEYADSIIEISELMITDD